MEAFRKLVTRDSSDSSSNETIINLMIAILSLIFFSLLLTTILILLRRMRRQQQMRAETLPQYHDVKRGNHRRLTIETRGFDGLGEKGRASVVIFRDGQPMLANPQSPPYSPDNVPEIHITFPDEQDEQGRPKSGRVVIVRVGETSVGLEPLHDQLPAYEKDSKSQFYAIDLEKIGGLKEKEEYC